MEGQGLHQTCAALRLHAVGRLPAALWGRWRLVCPVRSLLWRVLVRAFYARANAERVFEMRAGARASDIRDVCGYVSR